MNNLFDKKITARILSVLLATMLWLYVITEQNPVVYKDITLPVRLIGVETLAANNITMLDYSTYNVSLRLKGNKNTLDRINNTSITATADIRGYMEKGEFSIPIQISGIPAGVDINSMSANSIKIKFDNVVSVTMPVTMNITGNPLQGMAAMTPSVNPAEVTITGAESLVDKVKTAVVNLDISSSSTTVKKNTIVNILDEEGNTVKNLEVSPKSVDVVVPIELTKIVEIEPDVVVTPAPGYVVTSISTDPKEIYIAGKKEILDNLSSVKTEKIQLTDAKTFVNKKVSLVLPEGVELANKSETVSLNINIEKVIEKTIETENIAIMNLDESLTAEYQPITIGIVVKGIESVVNSWDASEAFYVDALDLTPGVHTLEIKYNKPDEVEILELEPKTVEITIKDKGEDSSDVSRSEEPEAAH